MLCSIVLSFMLVSANAQFRNIPAEVTDAFSEKYPTASHVKWRDKILTFQAEFEEEKQKMKASFSSDGDWIKTEKQLKFASLPAAVIDGFKKSKYADEIVKDITELDDSEKGLQYIIVVKKGDITKRGLYFTSSGQLVKDELNL